MKRRPRAHHRSRAGGIQAEEEDARLPGPRHVRPEVQLGEGRDPGKRGEPAGAEALQAKRRDRDPPHVFMTVERQALGDVGPEPLRIDGPVGEQEVAPPLRHDPGARGKRPGPVGAKVHRLPGDVHGGSIRGGRRPLTGSQCTGPRRNSLSVQEAPHAPRDRQATRSAKCPGSRGAGSWRPSAELARPSGPGHAVVRVSAWRRESPI